MSDNITAIDFLKDLNGVCHFQSREGRKLGPVSSRELRRWFDNGAVIINGNKAKWDDVLAFPLESLVLFPKNPVTLWGTCGLR